jgi:hypothetical protein
MILVIMMDKILCVIFKMELLGDKELDIGAHNLLIKTQVITIRF